MSRVAIACDPWKAATFQSVLEQYGYGYVEKANDIEGVHFFFIETDNVPKLHYVIQKAQRLCAELKN